MAKQGMKRPQRTHVTKHNDAAPVPEIQGKAKHGKDEVKPLITEADPTSGKVYHTTPFSADKPIAPVYAAIDTDLARDNLENDITAADLQDLS